MEQVTVELDYAEITMELGMLYSIPELTSLKRTIISNIDKGYILLRDKVSATKDIDMEEGFVSHHLPCLLEDGKINIKGEKGQLTLSYDHILLDCCIEEIFLENHYGETINAFRVGLTMKEKRKNFTLELLFTYKD